MVRPMTAPERVPRAGQVVLPPAEADLAPPERVRSLVRLSDPSLSELGLEEFLDELLLRVRDVLQVDTVAILLLDEAAAQLVARAAKGIEEEVEAGVRIPIGRGFAGRIAAERVAIYIADVNHADILNPILREKGISSLLGVPLIVEGDLIGVMHIGSLQPRVFDSEDLAVLQVAAARAAPGIERARLFSAHEHEHRVAHALQRRLVPRALDDFVGVSVSARYLVATDEVGGDWYDVFELSGGLVGIVIGDVVGHGLRAATLMGELRTALRAYALEHREPARTLEMTDRFLHRLGGDGMATALYAVLDTETGRLRLANAGHLPALFVGGSRPRRADALPSPPLGTVTYRRFTEEIELLAPGESLVLYTDGLVEDPGRPLAEGIDRLFEAIRGGESPELICRAAFAQASPEAGTRDDAAIIAVQSDEIPADLCLDLPAHPAALERSRRSLRRWLRRQGVEEPVLGQVVLAAGEACTNAIEHAYPPAPANFRLEATVRDGMLSISVSDQGEWREPRGQHRGRGMAIMNAVMDDVDVRAQDDGTRVALQKRVAS